MNSSFSTDNHWLAITGASGGSLLDTQTGQSHTFSGFEQATENWEEIIHSAVFSPDSTLLAAGYGNGLICRCAT